MENDVVKFSPGQMVSSTRLVRALAECLDRAQEQPLFITNRNKVVVVLISLEEYRRLLKGDKDA